MPSKKKGKNRGYKATRKCWVKFARRSGYTNPRWIGGVLYEVSGVPEPITEIRGKLVPEISRPGQQVVGWDSREESIKHLRPGHIPKSRTQQQYVLPDSDSWPFH